MRLSMQPHRALRPLLSTPALSVRSWTHFLATNVPPPTCRLRYVYPQRIEQLIALNVTALTKMSKLVLGGMKDRKRGAIVNISSISGSMPMSLLSVYSATKAYVDFFSQALATEYAADNITVQSVLPAFVSTKMR